MQKRHLNMKTPNSVFDSSDEEKLNTSTVVPKNIRNTGIGSVKLSVRGLYFHTGLYETRFLGRWNPSPLCLSLIIGVT